MTCSARWEGFPEHSFSSLLHAGEYSDSVCVI